MSPPAAFLLAHQGGWDEIAVLLGPIVVIGLVAWVGHRRNRSETAGTPAEPDPDEVDER